MLIYTGTFITELGSNIGSDKYLVNSNNILVSKLNPWFSRVIYPYNIDQAICSTEFIVLEPLRNINEYLYTLFTTRNFIKYQIIVNSCGHEECSHAHKQN